jgi:hypothetical protein
MCDTHFIANACCSGHGQEKDIPCPARMLTELLCYQEHLDAIIGSVSTTPGVYAAASLMSPKRGQVLTELASDAI